MGRVYGLFDGTATRSVFLPGTGRSGAVRGTGRFVAGRGADGRLCACDGMALAYVPETARGFWDDRRIAGVMDLVGAGGVGTMDAGSGAVPMSPDAIDQIVSGSLRGEVGAGVVMPDVSGAVWVGLDGGAAWGERGAWVDGKYAALLAGGLAGWTADGVAVSLACMNDGSGQYSRVIVRSVEDGGAVVLIVAAMVGVESPAAARGDAGQGAE